MLSGSEVELGLDPDALPEPSGTDDDARRTRERRFFAVTMGVTLVVTVGFLIRMFLYTDGHLVYVIDDAGIHLAIARNLVEHGTWGVTPGVYESASSSPAWTLMLAGVIAVANPLASVVPLVGNLLGAAWILWIYAKGQQAVDLRRGHWGSWALAIVLPLWALFLPSLAFTGMEHSVHAAIVLQVLVLLALLVRGGASRRQLAVYYALLFVGSCFRLETMFVAAGCGLALLFATTARVSGDAVATAWPWRRRILHTVGTGVAAAIPVLVIGMVNLAFDRRFFPNSVVAKTSLGGDESLFPTWDRVVTHLNEDALVGALVVLAIVYLVFTVAGFRGRQGAFALAFAATAVLHASFASSGWYERYQAYLIVIGLFLVLRITTEVVLPRWREAALVCIALAIVLFSFDRLFLLPATPLASSNTYRQQYQIGRFMDRYYDGRKIAVQDLGYVAYLHDGPVVDINGLGSHEVLDLIDEDRFDKDEMGRLIEREDVQAIALFPDQFIFRLPDDWIAAGEWKLGQKKISPLYSRVRFYARNERQAARLDRQLKEFRAELPDGVQTADRDRILADAFKGLGDDPEEPSSVTPGSD
jgi:hypothetical protein